MSRIFSLKTICWLMVAILVVSLIPLLWISFYSFPMADDFSFSIGITRAWENSHSLLSVLKAAWDTIVDFYLHWQGAYFTIISGMFQPAVLGEHLYFLTAWILLCAIITATFLFIHTVFRHLLQQENHYLATITSCAVLLLFIQWVPSPVQAFFWWNGGSLYIGAQAFLMFILTIIILCLVRDHCSIVQLAFLTLAVFLIGGGNYITALLQCEILALVFFYAIWKKKNIKFKILLILAVSLLGLLISVLAPGNAYRQSSYESMALLPSLIASFTTAFKDCLRWYPCIAIGMLFLIPFFSQLPVQSASKKVWLLPACVVLGFCIQASLYEPTFFAIGIKGEQRLDNVRFYVFVLQNVLWIFLAVQQAKWQFSKHQAAGHSDTSSRKWIKCTALVTAIVILPTGVLGIYNFKAHQITFSSASALVSLYKGKAQNYRSINLERLSILQTDEPNVVLPLHVDPPYVLMWDDIQADPEYWVNIELAEYYGKESIAGQ